ncbi:MAG: DMT family transporter [Anaerolineales bacterium]|nr:DMT family transporter [Anaerolineales bacterium]
MTPQTVRGALYGIGAAAIWGGLYVVADELLKVFPPFILLTIRLIMSGMVMLALLILTRTPLPKRRADWGALLAVGFLGYGISVGAQMLGTARSTAINGAVITSAAPAFIVLFAALFLAEPLTIRRIIALITASVGVLIVLNPQAFQLRSEAFVGDLALVFAAVTWGAYSVLVRRLSTQHPTLSVTLFGMVAGLGIAIPLGLTELSGWTPPPLTLEILVGLFYVGIISMAGAAWLWNRAFALVPAATASLFFFAQPLVGALLSMIILRQALTTTLQVGGALIVAGVFVALTEKARAV